MSHLKPNLPRSWYSLPKKEQQAITAACERAVHATVNHEEALLQKRWLQLACIVLHRQKDPYGKMRCKAFLKDWKLIYYICSQFNTDAELEAWLKAETDKIFGKDGYPHEWVDSLENGGKREGYSSTVKPNPLQTANGCSDHTPWKRTVNSSF